VTLQDRKSESRNPESEISSPPRLMIVAGEASGDAAGAALARELQETHGFQLYGIGGPRMRAAGVWLLFDSSTWSCLGLSESLRMVPRMLTVFDRLKELLRDDRPAALITIDFGAFNVPLARAATTLDIPVLYFMPPRSWDRDPRRHHSVAQVATKLATPFPWSAELLRRDGGDAVFVGHPLVDFCAQRRGRDAARVALGLEVARPVVGLLPGSRLQEMRYVLPLCLAGARQLKARRPDVQLVLGPAPNLPRAVVEHQLRRFGLDVPLVQDMAYDIMSAADALIVASGTATLEATCFETPMVVVYDGPATGRLEFKLTRRNVRQVSLPNIIAGRTVVPELLGKAVATPERLTAHVLELLTDTPARRQMLSGLRQVKAALGPGGAIRCTAQLVSELVGRSPRAAPAGGSTPRKS